MAYFYAMAAWDRDDFLSALDRVTCPVTILQSTSLDEKEIRRPATAHPSSRWLDAIRAQVPGAVIRLVTGTCHFVMLERPPLIADWIHKTLPAVIKLNAE